MISKSKLTELVHDWMNAWNGKDIDRLMNHYHNDVEFLSPVVAKRWSKADGKLVGKEEVRKHFLKGFEDGNHIPFELLGVLMGTSGVILVYRKWASGMAADVIELDEEGKVMKVSAYKSLDEL
jgi:hypothetical protein